MFVKLIQAWSKFKWLFPPFSNSFTFISSWMRKCLVTSGDLLVDFGSVLTCPAGGRHGKVSIEKAQRTFLCLAKVKRERIFSNFHYLLKGFCNDVSWLDSLQNSNSSFAFFQILDLLMRFFPWELRMIFFGYFPISIILHSRWFVGSFFLTLSLHNLIFRKNTWDDESFICLLKYPSDEAVTSVEVGSQVLLHGNWRENWETWEISSKIFFLLWCGRDQICANFTTTENLKFPIFWIRIQLISNVSNGKWWEHFSWFWHDTSWFDDDDMVRDEREFTRLRVGLRQICFHSLGINVIEFIILFYAFAPTESLLFICQRHCRKLQSMAWQKTEIFLKLER